MHFREELSKEDGKKKLFLVEGFLSCANAEIVKNHYDLVVFLDIDHDVALERRWKRSPKKQTKTEYCEFFDQVVWHHYLEYRQNQLANIGGSVPFVVVNANLEQQQVAKQVTTIIKSFMLHPVNTISKSSSDIPWNEQPSWFVK